MTDVAGDVKRAAEATPDGACTLPHVGRVSDTRPWGTGAIQMA